MYGMVNKGFAELVIGDYGAEKWDQIKRRAGIEAEVFLSAEQYPDKLTYDLVGAAVEVLGVAGNELLERFGEHWIAKTGRDGYGAMLQANGRSLAEFLINLPNLHSRVAMLFPDLEPPRFSVSEVTDTSLTLHYWSHRPGLTQFVVGLVRGLGKMFATEVSVAVLASTAQGAEHDVFAVSWQPPTDHEPAAPR